MEKAWARGDVGQSKALIAKIESRKEEQYGRVYDRATDRYGRQSPKSQLTREEPIDRISDRTRQETNQ